MRVEKQWNSPLKENNKHFLVFQTRAEIEMGGGGGAEVKSGKVHTGYPVTTNTADNNKCS